MQTLDDECVFTILDCPADFFVFCVAAFGEATFEPIDDCREFFLSSDLPPILPFSLFKCSSIDSTDILLHGEPVALPFLYPSPISPRDTIHYASVLPRVAHLCFSLRSLTIPKFCRTARKAERTPSLPSRSPHFDTLCRTMSPQSFVSTNVSPFSVPPIPLCYVL